MSITPLSFPLAQLPTPPEFRPPADLILDTTIPWWLYAVALATIMLIVALAWRFTRRSPISSPPASPAAQARSRLHQLANTRDSLSSKAFASAACDAIREFFQAEFSLPATRLTSQEFLSGVVSNHSIPGNTHAPLASFLKAVDAVCYAPPATADLHRTELIQVATSLVDSVEHSSQKTESGVAT